MKKNKFTLGWLFMTLLMLCCVTTACNDDDETATAVSFPQKQKIGGEVGDTKELTFDAVADWQLASSATWCRFVTETGEEFSLAGKAGSQTVTLKISAEGQDYGDNVSVATLSLFMGGQEAVIAEVVRNAKAYQLKVYKKVKKGDSDAEELVELGKDEPMVAGYDSYLSYVVKANFRFAATDRPEWLIIEGNSVVGAPNVDALVNLQVPASSVYAKKQQNGTLSFQDEAGKAFYSFPVSYAGMAKEAIRIAGPSNDPWNWEVALDGQTFSKTSISGAESTETTSTFRKFVEYNVTAFNDEYEALFVEKVEQDPGSGYFTFVTSVDEPVSEEQPASWMHMEKKGNGVTRITVDASDKEREGYIFIFPKVLYVDEPVSEEQPASWMHMEKKGNGVTRITVDASDKEREGYIFIFPKVLYDKVAIDPWSEELGFLSVERDIMTGEVSLAIGYQFEQNNLAMNVLQKEKMQEVGVAEFEVKLSAFSPVDCNVIDDEEVNAKITEKFGDVVAQAVNLAANDYVTISPKMAEDEFDASNEANVEVWKESEAGVLEDYIKEMKPEPMDMTSIGVTVPADAKEGTRLYIAFKNVSQRNETGTDGYDFYWCDCSC